MPAAKGCEIVYREPEPMTSPRVNRNLNRGFLIRVESVIELWYNKCWINCTKCMCYIHVWIILGTLIKIYTFITGWHELIIIRVSRTRAFIYHVYAIEDILRLVKLISGNLAAGNTVSDWLGDCEWGFPGTGSPNWLEPRLFHDPICLLCMQIQGGLDIPRSRLPRYSEWTHHGSPTRAIYGVSFVCSKFELGFAFVNVELHAISCYIGPRYLSLILDVNNGYGNAVTTATTPRVTGCQYDNLKHKQRPHNSHDQLSTSLSDLPLVTSNWYLNH